MFKPSYLHHTSCYDKCDKYVAESFGMLCWNVYKNNQKNPRFQNFLNKWVEKKNVDFILFQEAGFRDNNHFELSDFSFDAAANLEFRERFYGVLTASKVESNHAEAYLSQGKEGIIGPHKSFLLTDYSFDDSSSLLILNIHAINFRETKHYIKELEYIFALVGRHQGPMIIAGDFNSWNKKRTEKLYKFVYEHSFLAVDFDKTGKVKSFMGKNLDFIFYRGLELLSAEVVDKHKLSDHNPLFVRFKRSYDK